LDQGNYRYLLNLWTSGNNRDSLASKETVALSAAGTEYPGFAGTSEVYPEYLSWITKTLFLVEVACARK
jgi:hypothetical protein